MLALAGAALMALPLGANAAWLVEPSARLEVGYDDNVRLRSVDEEDAIVTDVNVQAALRNVTEISSVSALAGIGVTHYSGVDSFEDDTRERLYLVVASRLLRERGSFGLDGSLRREDLLRTIDVLGPGLDSGLSTDAEAGSGSDAALGDDLLTDGDADLGTVETLVRRTVARIQPHAGFEINPRTTVMVSYAFEDASFDGTADGDGIQDSRSHTGTLELQRQLSPRDLGSLQVQRSRFEPEVSREVDTWEARLGWERQITERVRSRLSVGASRIEADAGTDTGLLLLARVDRSLERGGLYAIVERTLRPSAFGEVLEFDQIVVGSYQRLSDRLSWSLRARASRNDASAAGGFDRSQKYADFSPSLRWLLTPAWSVAVNYTYTWVDRDRDSTSASRNAIGISLSYAPPRRL